MLAEIFTQKEGNRVLPVIVRKGILLSAIGLWLCALLIIGLVALVNPGAFPSH